MPKNTPRCLGCLLHGAYFLPGVGCVMVLLVFCFTLGLRLQNYSICGIYASVFALFIGTIHSFPGQEAIFSLLSPFSFPLFNLFV